jgi:hypothetical protein
VLVLVAVVAIAATGSVPRGTNESRGPSKTLLDTLFTLWIVAVIAGAILLVYGLSQRRAIAKQVASGRYPRWSAGAWIAFVSVTIIAYWALRQWTPQGQGAPDEGVFVGRIPTLPTTSDEDPVTPYEPSVSWLPIAIVGGLVAVAVIAHVVSGRRSRAARDARAGLAEELAAALDDALDDLRAEADPRRAIIAAYARLERILAANGIARRQSETPDEYLVRVLGDLELTPEAIGRLTALFTEAKFSHHDVDSRMKESAIDALERVRDELGVLADTPSAPEQRPAAATS